MKRFTLLVLLASVSAVPLSFAHDEGHGPKITDTAKQGGIVSPVIDTKEMKKGPHAAVIYKAELVRTEDGSVRVYFYDKEMNSLDIGKFDKSAKAVLGVEKKKKFTKTSFALSQAEGAFMGKTPKPTSKPFNIDVHVKEGTRDLMVAFDNLD